MKPEKLELFETIADTISKEGEIKDHLTLGSGEINLKERLKIAEKYGCRCVIETKTVEALRESVKYMEKYLDFSDKSEC